MIKGFDSMLVAAAATDDTTLWHLLKSKSPDTRIPYTDPRLDTMNLQSMQHIPLQSLQHSRHVVGWCSKAKELCGT